MGRLPLAIVSLMVAAAVGPARGAPLDDAACVSLSVERDGLIAQGVKDDMAKGPAWAKANLAEARMKAIAHLIEIEEQLSFRCPRSPLFMAPGRALWKKKEQLAKGQDQGQVKSDGAVEAQPKQDDLPASLLFAPEEPAKPAATQKKKRKTSSKPKPSDAYVPPPAPPGSDGVLQ